MRAAQRFVINGDHLPISRRSDHFNPRDEALLEFSGVQPGNDIANYDLFVVMMGSSSRRPH